MGTIFVGTIFPMVKYFFETHSTYKVFIKLFIINNLTLFFRWLRKTHATVMFIIISRPILFFFLKLNKSLFVFFMSNKETVFI